MRSCLAPTGQGAHDPQAVIAAFAKRDLWNIEPRARAGLIHHNVGCWDYLTPLLRFLRNELSEVGGRERQHSTA